MTTFQLHCVDLRKAIQPCVDDVVASSYTMGLISDDIYETVTSSTTMPPSDKVTHLLRDIRRSITSDGGLLQRFVEILRQHGSRLEEIGKSLDSTYRELTQLPHSKKAIIILTGCLLFELQMSEYITYKALGSCVEITVNTFQE